MEISVQGTHEETVRPEIGRLHAVARAEASGKAEVLRTATEVVHLLQSEFKRLQQAGAVTEIVVRPISTSSWRPVARGRQQPAIYRAQASLLADFTDFAALADLAAQFGDTEGLELNWVEWRLTESTRRDLENTCLTRAVEQARDRALVMARAAGAGEVTFVQLADPGLLGERARGPRRDVLRRRPSRGDDARGQDGRRAHRDRDPARGHHRRGRRRGEVQHRVVVPGVETGSTSGRDRRAGPTPRQQT